MTFGGPQGDGARGTRPDATHRPTWSGRARRGMALALVIATAGAGAAAPAQAAIPLIDSEKGKLDMEFRFMAWAMDAGPDLPLLPGVNTLPPPAQEENIEDFFVRRMRLVFRGQASKSLDFYFQFGFDNSGSKVLRDDAGVRVKDAFI